jgi:hypothetical protein
MHRRTLSASGPGSLAMRTMQLPPAMIDTRGIMVGRAMTVNLRTCDDGQTRI